MMASFPVLGKLRPVSADALLVVEPASRMSDGESHRRQALGCRVHQDHGVVFQGSPVDLFRIPPHKSTTFRPPWYTQQAPPSSCRRAKFSANASRTASHPGLTCPSIRMRWLAFMGETLPSVRLAFRRSAPGVAASPARSPRVRASEARDPEFPSRSRRGLGESRPRDGTDRPPARSWKNPPLAPTRTLARSRALLRSCRRMDGSHRGRRGAREGLAGRHPESPRPWPQ